MKQYLLILILVVFHNNLIFGQIITGTITLEDDLPANSVAVCVAGTNIGTFSNIYGKYEITVDTTIHKDIYISHIGYETKKISIYGNTTINVCLEKEPWELGTLKIEAHIQPKRKGAYH